MGVWLLSEFIRASFLHAYHMQVVLMSDALGTRTELMTDLYSLLDWLEDRSK